MEVQTQHKDLSTTEKNDAREAIVSLEEAIKGVEGCIVGTGSDRYPLKHSFANNIYVREIFIPAGDLVVGQIHKHEHPNFLMSGTVRMYTEDNDYETITGPCSMISSPGTKRALFAETDLVWITVHNNPNDTRDIDELEESIAVSTYGEYEEFKKEREKLLEYKKKNSLRYRLTNRLIKFLEVCQ